MDLGLKQFENSLLIQVPECLCYREDLGYLDTDEDVTCAVFSGAGFEKCAKDTRFFRARVRLKVSLGFLITHNFNYFNVVCARIQGYDFVYEKTDYCFRHGCGGQRLLYACFFGGAR